VVAASGVGLTACGRAGSRGAGSLGAGSSGAATAQPAAAGPSSSPSGLDGVLGRFVAVNNAANAARDDALLRAVESGTSLVLDLAGYAVSRGTDPAGSRSGGGFDLVEPTWWVSPQDAGPPDVSPPDSGRPRWAVVRAHGRSQAPGSAPAPSATYLAFAQDAPAGGWSQEYAVDVAPSAGPVPDPAGPACAQARDTAALSQLVAGWLAALRGSGPADGNRKVIAGERFRSLLRQQAEVERVALAALGDGGALHPPQLIADVLDRRPERVASLRLAGGGCLAFFATQERRTYRASTSAGLTVAGAYRALGAGRDGVAPAQDGAPPTRAEVVSVDQWLAVVPPDGSAVPGQIVGHAGGLVEVRLG